MEALQGRSMPSEDTIRKFYNSFSGSNLELLDSFYHPQIRFEDPLEKVDGLEDLKGYFARVYRSITEINFDFQQFFTEDDTICAVWTMSYCTPALNRGQPIRLPGVSIFKLKEGKVIYHRDIFDTAAMLHRELPVLGRIIKLIEGRLRKRP